MIPTSGSETSTPFPEFLHQANTVSSLSTRILQCVQNLIPQEAALFVPGNPSRMVSPDGFPPGPLKELQEQIESAPQLLRDFALRPLELHSACTFKDGSAVFIVPIVYEGTLVSMLCLHSRDRNSFEQLNRQLKPLQSLCNAAAEPLLRLQAVGLSPQALVTSRLLGAIAHDIRNPITVIRGYLKLIMNGRMGSVTEEQKECLSGAMSSVDQLMQLAGRVGGLSETMEHFHPEVLNLRDLCAMAGNSARIPAREKDILFVESIPADPLPVWGDRNMLSRLLEDLLFSTVILAVHHTELSMEMSRDRSGDTILKIAFSCGSTRGDAENVVSELQAIVFLHGGKLTLNPKNLKNDSGFSFTLSFPGLNA